MPARLLCNPTLRFPHLILVSALTKFANQKYFEVAVLVPFLDHLISQIEARYQLRFAEGKSTARTPAKKHLKHVIFCLCQ